MGVTHYPNGVTTASQGETLQNFGMLDPTKWSVYFDDMHKYTAADWTITTTEAGGSSATEVVGNEANGTLVITNDENDNDADYLQSDNEMFSVTAGKRLLFKSKFKVSDAEQSDWLMGLQVTDTTPLSASAGMYFQSDDGDSNIDIHSAVASALTSATAIATASDDTYVTLGFDYDGASTVTYYVDDVRTGVLDLGTLSTEALAISFGIVNGAAQASMTGSVPGSLTIDYIFAAKER